jgi:Phage protein GP46
MTDIQLIIASDMTTIDWCPPAVLAQAIDSSQDVVTYITMLLCTDRVTPEFHYGLQPVQRRGSWHDAVVGEFGSLFWLGTEANQWNQGSKINQIQRWAEQALQTVYDEAMILQPAVINVSWLTNESVQILVNVILSDGTSRKITYALGI